MKPLQIQTLELGDGCYMKNGNRITNFILGAEQIKKKGGKVAYHIEVDIGDEIFEMNILPEDLNRRRFLSGFPAYIEKETEFYKLLRKSLFEKKFDEEEVIHHTEENGLQIINGNFVFVFSNGGLSKNGFCKDVSSQIEGVYLPEEAVLQPEHLNAVIEKLFMHYNICPRVFYTLFFNNIMAITNGYFRSIGEDYFMKLTIWLDGVTDSGKSRVVEACGTYTFRDEKLEKEYVSATVKKRYAMRRLSQMSGSVFILDDYKAEEVRERRNSVKLIIDDIIRSVFQGKMTDVDTVNSQPKPIDACAVITGEFVETKESLNARMVYINIDRSMTDEVFKNTVQILKVNRLWLTSVCAGYIQWLLKRMEERSFQELLKARLKELRQENQEYGGIDSAVRLNENRRMLEMAKALTTDYFKEVGMPKGFVHNFEQNAKQSIEVAMDSTFRLLGAETAIMTAIMEKIFSNSKIRNAAYQESCWSSKYKYNQEHFWIHEEDEFVWISDYQKSLAKKNSGEHEQYVTPAILLIRETILKKLIKKEIELLEKDGRISTRIIEKLKNEFERKLREMQVIYKRYRADCKWGRKAVNYPVFRNKVYEGYDGYGGYMEEEEIVCHVRYEPVVQINTEHPCVRQLKERINNNTDLEGAFKDVDSWKICDRDEGEIYRERRSFMNSKTLYKE